MNRHLPGLGLLLLATACSGGSGDAGRAGAGVGSFIALQASIGNGQMVALNQAITIEFNHALDMESVSFSSVQIRPLSEEALGHPVTGQFWLQPGSGGEVLVFQPSCPTDEEASDGGFLPGGLEYELALPTATSGTGAVLRDRAGRLLARGLSVRFRTPEPPTEPLYLDTRPGAPDLLDVRWPQGLNLFSDPDPVVALQFDQPLEPGETNLGGDRFQIRYAEEVLGEPGEDSFPEENRVPLEATLRSNCEGEGAEVELLIAGILPDRRRLRLVVEAGLRDLVGEATSSELTGPGDHETPSLGELWSGTGWDEDQEAVDEIADGFGDGSWVDASAPLALPVAEIGDGWVGAGFDWPGIFVGEDADFVWGDGYVEISTDGSFAITDSENRSFLVQNGVWNVDDFVVEAGSTLRVAVGSNPLVIYATGEVRIDGTLDLSGGDAQWPSSIATPCFPEGGGSGIAGGGGGGTASLSGSGPTLRGESGDGAFGTPSGGGQGGEGSFQVDSVDQGDTGLLRRLAGGGGGGGFARTPNVTLWWSEWTPAEVPDLFDDALIADHREDRHTAMTWNTLDWLDQNPFWPLGAEDGMRGSSFENDLPEGSSPHGTYGMEDQTVDRAVPAGHDTLDTLDPAWTSGDEPPFHFGDPAAGPDGGQAGGSPFSADGNPLNDFWGTRVAADGSVEVGELLAPWAGSGGGAGGDSHDMPGVEGPLSGSWPPADFVCISNFEYHKGGGGGGGAGQLLLFAIGEIGLGQGARILARGGAGVGGQGAIGFNRQVSGSGGGSGGHVVLHSATGLDLSAVDITDGATLSSAADVFNWLVDERFTPDFLVQTRGGRRGHAGSSIDFNEQAAGFWDGNNTFMLARGGAGANGLFQVHVPDPASDIRWHPNVAAGFAEFARNGDPDGPVDPDRLEQLLGLVSAPQPFVLVPFFSARSQVQSRWIDTGLAHLRRSPDGPPFVTPDWTPEAARFDGVQSGDPDPGRVLVEGDVVIDAGVLISGDVDEAEFDSRRFTLPSASSRLSPASGRVAWLRIPELWIGSELRPAASDPGVLVEAAAYDPDEDVLVLDTDPEGEVLTSLLQAGEDWELRLRWFTIETESQDHVLPEGQGVWIEFQGADDPDDPESILPSEGTWTADLEELTGRRFVRYRITFDLDTEADGDLLETPRPRLRRFKLPFAW